MPLLPFHSHLVGSLRDKICKDLGFRWNLWNREFGRTSIRWWFLWHPYVGRDVQSINTLFSDNTTVDWCQWWKQLGNKKMNNLSSSPPISCSQCGKTKTDFSSSSNFQRHLKIHEKRNEVSQCTLCGKQFQLKSAMSAHLKNVH